MSLEELSHKQEIHDVLMRYCRAVDRLDEDLLRSVYFPDAWDDHGSFSGSVEDFIAWTIPFCRQTFSNSLHTISNVLIELKEARAFSEAYFTCYFNLTQDGKPFTRVISGRYLDHFQRRNGEWRIFKRTVVKEWDRLEPLEHNTAPNNHGKFGPDDVVYRLRQECLYGQPVDAGGGGTK